ncbi:MAG: peptide chain release factor N(5)-glutamine methyltransferase [Rhodobacteraceae bacterium]|nr:peptide chain release factor N(5)-glutamine methyltransferase [Paracoccaceae bacterium]
MRAQDALGAGVARLRAAGIDGAARDGRRLMAHALGVAEDRLLLALDEQMTPDQARAFDAAITARTTHQPVAQITGKRLFWGRNFRVTPDVLDPRPETETLIAAALERPFANVLDLGTGSGAILLTLLAERVQATGLGVDLSDPALAVAQGNARALGLQKRATFRRSDWFSAVQARFDMIVSNPPYIGADEVASLAPDVRKWEPRMALVPEDCDGTGLAAYRRICAGAPTHLRSGGWLLVEIGAGQGPQVAEMLRAVGFDRVQVVPDLDGRNRVVLGQWPRA